MGPHDSRRRHPRIEIDGSLRVLDVSVSEWVEICNVSEGGFQTLSRTRPRQGDVHTFKVVLDHKLYSVMATAVYVRAARVAEYAGWLTGWRASEDVRSSDGLTALITSATDVKRLLQAESSASAGPRSGLPLHSGAQPAAHADDEPGVPASIGCVPAGGDQVRS